MSLFSGECAPSHEASDFNHMAAQVHIRQFTLKVHLRTQLCLIVGEPKTNSRQAFASLVPDTLEMYMNFMIQVQRLMGPCIMNSSPRLRTITEAEDWKRQKFGRTITKHLLDRTEVHLCTHELTTVVVTYTKPTQDQDSRHYNVDWLVCELPLLTKELLALYGL